MAPAGSEAGRAVTGWAATVLGVAGIVGVALVGCGSDRAEEPGDGVTVPDGFEIDEVVSGLDGPTQVQVLDDGRLLVAQLNGDEGEPGGQVLIVDPESGERSVVVDGLVSPTGVAAVGDDLWVMEQRRLSHGSLASGELETVIDELPFNGRSEGTLTALDDGRLLYNTSGTITSNRAADGSGALWAIDGSGTGEPEVVAVGFKNAYGRTVGSDGRLWQAEVADGSFDGEPAPDELVALPPSVLDDGAAGGSGAGSALDAGWPRCIGDRAPVAQYGGTTEVCADTVGAQATFEPGATPTSVAVSPWDDDTLLVALWNDGRVVSVSADPADQGAEPTTWLTGLDHPQHLVADGDRLLVVDFSGGRILSVERSS